MGSRISDAGKWAQTGIRQLDSLVAEDRACASTKFFDHTRSSMFTTPLPWCEKARSIYFTAPMTRTRLSNGAEAAGLGWPAVTTAAFQPQHFE